MCGIFGYYNYRVPQDRQAILEFLLTGLRRLEYRGYDSAGLCIDGSRPTVMSAPTSPKSQGVSTLFNGAHNITVNANGHAKINANSAQKVANAAPMVIKSQGKIDALVKLAYETLEAQGVDLSQVLQSHAALAHTRWATHGPPSARNSHPHVSDTHNAFVVVHNGIITNHKALKDVLVRRGVKFESDTDTEVIPKLLKYVYDEQNGKISFTEVVMDVVKQLEGAWGLLIMSSHYPGEMVACKHGSPLIVGLKESPDRRSPTSPQKRRARPTLEAFIASDASAMVEHTKRVIVLEDDDIVHFQRSNFSIYNLRNECHATEVPRALLTLEMEVNSIMKGGYNHFMQKEIHEQPESLFQTMQGRVIFKTDTEDGSSVLDPYLERRVSLGGLADHLSNIKRGRRIMFIACGTSFHAALACRQTIEELVDMPVTLELASDLIDRRTLIFRDDMCVFVSQSGETADTLQALQYAKKRGAFCIGVTNTVGSAIARMTDCGVHINAGCEIGVASTKAYTSQMVAITMMALALSEDSIYKRAQRDAIIDGLGELPKKVQEVLQLDSDIRALAEELQSESSLLVFGRGYNYATALEAALKVKEVAIMHSEGILAGEMKHGPLALVDESLPIVLFATRDRMYAKMLSVIQQLLARSARLIVVCNHGDMELEELAGKSCRLIKVPEIVECLQPIINIVPLQLLSYHLTVLRGYNVDQPRNLAKSVTVTED
eukprot:jgi/Botrbrau1/1472/Bobra.178_3s0029.1